MAWRKPLFHRAGDFRGRILLEFTYALEGPAGQVTRNRNLFVEASEEGRGRMRIGLARHFRIPHRKREMLDAAGYSEWLKWYDASHGPANPIPDTGVAWDKCYCSDILRAKITAGRIFDGPTEETPLLREVPMAPPLETRLPMPLFLWETISRMGWMWEHRSQPESRTQTRKRASGMLQWIRDTHPDQNILVVSHGFLMQVLERELVKAGFRGAVPIHPKGGHIYVFET